MNSEITIFLLDDDAIFLSALQTYLQGLLEQQTSYSCQLFAFETIESMLQSAKQNSPSLLIADIELPDSKDGISAADELHAIAPNCSIIYLTAYLQYAPDIFETDPLYFIVKEQYRDRLPTALNKFFTLQQTMHRKVHLHTGGQHITVDLDDVIYCEHFGKNVQVISKDETWSVRSTLSEFMKQFPADQFVLCHKSFLVNLAQVKSISGMHLTMSNGATINISRSYRDAFRQAHSRWLSSLL